MKQCPFCAEEIQDQAIKCRYCGEFLEQRSNVKWYFRTPTMIFAFLCVGPFMLPLVWLHPTMGRAMKIAVSAAVLLVTVLLWHMTSRGLESINEYYGILWQ